MGRILKERYITRIGKFGVYFYDVNNQKEMTLEDVVNTMNNLYTILKDEGYMVG